MIYKHALIIEDDDFMQELILDFIQELNIPSTVTATNGQLGINSISNKTPDLIILDINLPIIDGFQVIDFLANINFMGKLIIISGTQQHNILAAQLLAKWSNINMGQYLHKPFSQSDLINSIII